MNSLIKERLKIRKAALLIAVLFSFFSADAQIADTLKEVKIKAEREQKVSNDERVNTYAPGQEIITIDTTTFMTYQFQDMANLLSQQVPVFVKSYGINNIATLNFRGASAAQSQVYWNGVPIQNAALGISDVSLLPVALMNKVNVVYGSSAALWGSGNVGGALLVENDLPEFNEEGSFSQSVSAVAGSYGNYRAGLKSAISSEKFTASVNLFGQTMNNDFNYTDVNGAEQTLSNAKMQNGVGLLHAGYKVNDRNIISFRGWYQQYYREIPPALFESASAKNQRDESLRLLLNWDRKSFKTSYYSKLSYIRDFMWYRDSLIALESKNITNQLYAEAGVNHRFNEHHRLLLFTPVQIAWMDRVLAGDVKTQNRYALAAAYLYTGLDRKLNVSVNARAEAVNNTGYILPGLNSSYSFTKWLLIRGNVQRTYRVPTLNELYYNPGGNPTLNPEQGWNEDIGYELHRDKHKVHLQHSLSFYNRNIHDWILWFGGAIWTPHNIATVHSRGLQTTNRFEKQVRDIMIHVSANYSYTLATTQSSYLPGDGSIGKQIPYTPVHMGQANIGFSWQQLYLNYNHTFTGVRYITTDESFALEEYYLGNIQLLYRKQIQEHELQLTVQCNNIWNADYYVVNARPMPGINWLAGLSFTFNR